MTVVPATQKGDKDKWDKIDILLKGSTALAVGLVGFWTSNILERSKSREDNFRLYSELMSKQEEAESLLRKDMFENTVKWFLDPQKSSLDDRVLSLEQLAYNFHDSLNLRPLFLHVWNLIDSSPDAAQQNEKLRQRLNKVASDIKARQRALLEEVGDKFDKFVDLENFRNRKNNFGIPLQTETVTVKNITRTIGIVVEDVDPKTKGLKVRLTVSTGNPPKRADSAFWAGFFDFPMIDNIRLSDDQRCAIIVTKFEDPGAEITVICFPGSYASLKERPIYDDVVQDLRRTSEMLGNDATKLNR
jgi:hypothetical protein